MAVDHKHHWIRNRELPRSNCRYICQLCGAHGIREGRKQKNQNLSPKEREARFQPIFWSERFRGWVFDPE